MEEYPINKIIANKSRKLKQIENQIRKKTRLEAGIELCTSNDKGHMQKEIIKTKDKISSLKKGLLEEKVFDEVIMPLEHVNSIILKELESIKQGLMSEYKICRSCLYSTKWPDGTRIEPEKKILCALYSNFNTQMDGCYDHQFNPDFNVLKKEYDTKLAYLCKKIAEVAGK